MNFFEKAQELGVKLSDEQLQKFDKFYEMLIEKNKVMNLTGITEYEDVINKHFIDSLSINLTGEFKNSKSIIDIGTGAGFPGIPLKIAFPDKKIVLVDSLNKRINFIKEVIDELSLDNIEAIHSRAEELAKNPLYREKFDICCSRAVSNLATLSEYCLPFVKEKGFFISYKSENIADEIENSLYAINILGGKLDKTLEFTLPETDNNRKLVRIKKVKITPNKYPRAGAKPTKEPLLKK